MTVPAQTIPYLTEAELAALTRFEWMYSLEAHGFDPKQADRILFWRWMVDARRVAEQVYR